MEIKKQSKSVIKILKSKEKKIIINIIKKQWKCNFNTDLTFLINNKNRIYLINNEFAKIDLTNIKINHLGLYFGEFYPKTNEIRLSVEGSQLIGPIAEKNTIELNKEETRCWLKGTDIKTDTDKKPNTHKFVILKNSNDFLGCGRTESTKITNFMPKTRRILCSD